MNTKRFTFGEDTLTIKKAMEIVRGERKCEFGEVSLKRVKENREAVLNIVKKKKIVYGINTGFGSLCTTIISEEDTQKLQWNILKSHSVGVGDFISDELAKLMLVLKLQALSQGYSGVALETIERIKWHIENNVIPLVPCQGSVGASGDLAPLSHLFLPLIGLGKVKYKGEIVDTAYVLQKENLAPVDLGAKEGLALINGTQFITAHAVKGLERFLNCLDSADIIGAMTLEGLLGSVKPFEPKLHEIRPYDGSRYVAHRLRELLKGSEMVASHQNCGRVQDPYSLRCMPQVHGASRNTWLHLKELVNIEMNSVTDNPIVLDENNTISGGNFHGQLLAMPLDYATLAASEIGNIADRRTYLLLEGKTEGLPVLLMKNTGINSGFMIPQYTTAALVTENKTLCFPASADSVPTSLGQEDHVSMGSISGRKFNQVLDNVEKILGIELLCAAQAFDFRKPLNSSKVLEACHDLVRERIEFADEDRLFYPDIINATDLIKTYRLSELAKKVAEQNSIDLIGEYGKEFCLD